MKIELATGRLTALLVVILITILVSFNLLAALGDYEDSPVEEAVEENADMADQAQVVAVREAMGDDTGLAYPGYTGKETWSHIVSHLPSRKGCTHCATKA